MLLIPLFEEERSAPDLIPIADLLIAMKTIKKTLLVWETQKSRISYSDLVSYIDESIRLSKQIPGQ
jgi:hypothetical protein